MSKGWVCRSDLHTKVVRWEKMCVGFIDLEKAIDRLHRETLWQVLKMYDVGAIRFIVHAGDFQLVCYSSIKRCLYLFLCMAERQCYGRIGEIELGLYRWTPSEAC